jgi:hypothetical protein
MTKQQKKQLILSKKTAREQLLQQKKTEKKRKKFVKFLDKLRFKPDGKEFVENFEYELGWDIYED